MLPGIRHIAMTDIKRLIEPPSIDPHISWSTHIIRYTNDKVTSKIPNRLMSVHVSRTHVGENAMNLKVYSPIPYGMCTRKLFCVEQCSKFQRAKN